MFSSSFSGSKLDTSKWQTCYPWYPPGVGCTNLGNDEQEWYLPGQVHVANGQLQLVAQRGHDVIPATFDPSTLPPYYRSSTFDAAKYTWASGMVTTYASCDFTYGYVQVTARIPKGRGLWPTLWLLPKSESWPPEIDILETHGTATSTAVLTTFVDANHYLQKKAHSVDLSRGFHTYAIDWEPTSITWFLDGKQAYRVTSGVPQVPMYFLADLAVDGRAGKAPDNTTPRTASLDIKAVSIWQKR